MMNDTAQQLDRMLACIDAEPWVLRSLLHLCPTLFDGADVHCACLLSREQHDNSHDIIKALLSALARLTGTPV